MFLYLSVSHSAHRGVYPSMHWGQTPLGRQNPWVDIPPRQIPPLVRHLPWSDTSPGQCMLGYTPPAQCMLGYTPCPMHAGIDMATAAVGTHPTGMHSCNKVILYQCK